MSDNLLSLSVDEVERCIKDLGDRSDINNGETTSPPPNNIINHLLSNVNDDGLVSFGQGSLDPKDNPSVISKVCAGQNFGPDSAASAFAVIQAADTTDQGNGLPSVSHGHNNLQDNLSNTLQNNVSQNLEESNNVTNQGNCFALVSPDNNNTLIGPIKVSVENGSQIFNIPTTQPTYIVIGDVNSIDWGNSLASVCQGDSCQAEVISTGAEVVGTSGGGTSSSVEIYGTGNVAAANANGCNTVFSANTIVGIAGSNAGTGVTDMNAIGIPSKQNGFPVALYEQGNLVDVNPNDNYINNPVSADIISMDTTLRDSQPCPLGPKKTGRKKKSGELVLHKLNISDYEGEERTRIRKAKNAYNRRMREKKELQKKEEVISQLKKQLSGIQK